RRDRSAANGDVAAHRAGSRVDQRRVEPVKGATVRERDVPAHETEVSLTGRGSEDHARGQKGLLPPCAFVVEEVEHLVLDDRPSARGAELVLLQEFARDRSRSGNRSGRWLLKKLLASSAVLRRNS